MNEARVSTRVAKRENVEKVANRRSRKREWMHSQGCSLCGSPALALASAPARLLSDARSALRALPSPMNGPKTQSQPPSLSDETQLLCQADERVSHPESATHQTSRSSNIALVSKTSPLDPSKTVIPKISSKSQLDDEISRWILATRFVSSLDDQYLIEYGPVPGVAVLRARAENQTAKIVLINFFVDRVLTNFFDSWNETDSSEFSRGKNLDARLCKQICRRVKRQSSAGNKSIATQRNHSLVSSKIEIRLTNKRLQSSNTELKTGKSGEESDFTHSADYGIHSSNLPQSDHVGDTESCSFTFVRTENPILSDLDSFSINCTKDDKNPTCDQLFFQILFYQNVIGLNLLSPFADFVEKKEDALIPRTSTKIKNDNLKNLVPFHKYHLGGTKLSETTHFRSENNAVVETKTSQQENGCHPDSEGNTLRSKNFVINKNTRFLTSETEKLNQEGASVRGSTTNFNFIELYSDTTVEEGCEINQSSAQDLHFIRDLIPCYEQFSRTDEQLREEINERPFFTTSKDLPSQSSRDQIDTSFDHDKKFDTNQVSYFRESIPQTDFTLEPTISSEQSSLNDAPVPFSVSVFPRNNAAETRVSDELLRENYPSSKSLGGYMSVMKQKTSLEDTTGCEEGDAPGAEKPLKSALKKGSRSQKSGHRVKFNESLNKFFDADYVILVREDSEYVDRFGEVCECGDEFCDGRYYEDEESDDDDFILSSCPHEDCMDHNHGPNRFRPGYEFPSGGTFEPPLEFVDQDVTLSPPDGYKDGCCSHQFPEPSEPVIHAHPSTNQKYERDHEESITPVFTNSSDQGSKSSEARGRNLRNNFDVENPYPQEEGNLASKEQEKSDFVPETNILKLSNLYNRGKLSPNSVERNLGLKLRTLNSNQSLKPNSAVRQLFPSSNFILPPQFAQKSPDLEDPSLGNSYARFVPNSSLFHMYTSIEDDEDDDGLLGNNLFRKTIEKNSLRRSLIRYPKDYRKRKCKGRGNSENSLTERIKKLTCDIDDDENLNSYQNELVKDQMKPQQQETSDLTQEQQTHMPQPSEEQVVLKPEKIENSEKPTSITEVSSTSSTVSSTYRKLTDLFSRKSDKSDINSNSGTRVNDQQQQPPQYRSIYQTAPDLGNGLNIPNKYPVTKSSTEARKQFLSSLAPLAACVSGNFESSSPHGHLSLNLSGNRNSMASVDSNVSSEYSLNDIDEALGRTRSEPTKLAPQPDVVAGTPAGNSDAGNNDELALFVQQDAGRIERLKNRYGNSTNGDSDDDNDDYGFHRRPSVRGIKPRFGSTTEIIQQIQSQLQPPPALNPANIGSHMTWPYYTVEQKSFVTSDTSNTLITTDTGIAYSRNHPSKLMTNCSESGSEGISSSIPYTNRYAARASNVVYHQDLLATNRECPIYRNQRMVQMHLSPLPASQQVRFSAPSPQFKHEMSSHYLVQTPQSGITSIIHVEQGQQQTIRVPYPTSGPVQVHLQTSRRSESPILQNQHSISVRSTQTSTVPYYNPKPLSPYYNYGPLVYVDHPRAGLSNNNCMNSNLGSPMSSVTSSPTRSKPETSLCAERGVPEGAASVPINYQQDALYAVPVPPMSQETVITLTPTSQPNSSVYYAMNV